MKLSLERKIALGSAAAGFVLLLVTGAVWWNVARFQSTHYWVGHSRDVLSGLEAAVSDVLSMQSSTRGYVLTGSEEVLTPFTVGSAHLDSTLAQVRHLTTDNASQQASLSKLEPLAARAREIMHGRIDARRLRGLNAAGETSAYLDGQRAVEAFRAIAREMMVEERRLLDDRLSGVERFSQLTVVTIVATTLLALGLVAIAVRVVGRDLLLRREAETALQESFARVEDLYNKAPCGYHSLGPTGVFLAINDTALAWLGYTREEVVGRMNFADILTPASLALFHTRFETFRRTGAAKNVEYDWRRRDGTVLPVLLNATAIYDQAGHYTASRATVFDLTERKRAEAERDRFFTLSRDLLCIATLQGGFKRVNPAWQDTLGFDAAELSSHSLLELVHPDDRERTGAELARLAAGEDWIEVEHRLRTKDGAYRWLRWSARASAREQLFFGSARDVTNNKEAEERIQALNAALGLRAQQLEAANRELESFSYSVSHDLRAPLRHIDGFASLLSKRVADTLDAEAVRYISTISKSAKKMGTLIDDLLAFSRIGRTELRLEPVNQDQLVASVAADVHPDKDAPKVQWEIGPLPRVRADPAMLRQVWVNLLDNAVKYSSKTAAPRIAIAAATSDARDEHIFSVADNGVGFDMAYIDKLFGVFQRLHGPKEFDGTGIGLANVRRIVTRHGGRTWAEGREGMGATFYFSLPSHASLTDSSL